MIESTPISTSGRPASTSASGKPELSRHRRDDVLGHPLRVRFAVLADEGARRRFRPIGLVGLRGRHIGEHRHRSRSRKHRQHNDIRLIAAHGQVECPHRLVRADRAHAQRVELGGDEAGRRPHAQTPPRRPRDADCPVAEAPAMPGHHVEERVRARVRTLAGEAGEVAARREQHHPVQLLRREHLVQSQRAVDLRPHRRRDVLGSRIDQKRTGLHPRGVNDAPYRRQLPQGGTQHVRGAGRADVERHDVHRDTPRSSSAATVRISSESPASRHSERSGMPDRDSSTSRRAPMSASRCAIRRPRTPVPPVIR